MQDALRDKLSHLPRWTPIATLFLGSLLIITIIILIFTSRSTPTNDEREFIANAYDITDSPVNLSNILSDAAASDPRKDYQTELTSTAFANLTAQDFCASLHFSCADALTQPLTELTTLTPNILNYYLDNHSAILIVSRASTIVVYGAIYTTPNYLIFTTSQADYDTYSYASPAELFNSLTGVEDFYLLATN